MRSYELLREGEVSTDGRMIWPGATTWGDTPVPVIGVNQRVLGKLVNIRRDGRSIFGDSDVDAECLTVSCVGNFDNVQAINDLRIISAHVSRRHDFPWRDEVA